jgi:hypothetical protein
MMSTNQVPDRDTSAAGVLELVLATVGLPAIRLPVTLFSWFLVGPALGVNLGALVPHGVGVVFSDAWVYFWVDNAIFVAMIIGGMAGAVARRVQLPAQVYRATTAWYCLGLVVALIVLLTRDPSFGAEKVEVVAAIVAANILIGWLSSRALAKSRAAGRG